MEKGEGGKEVEYREGEDGVVGRRVNESLWVGR